MRLRLLVPFFLDSLLPLLSSPSTPKEKEKSLSHLLGDSCFLFLTPSISCSNTILPSSFDRNNVFCWCGQDCVFKHYIPSLVTSVSHFPFSGHLNTALSISSASFFLLSLILLYSPSTVPTGFSWPPVMQRSCSLLIIPHIADPHLLTDMAFVCFLYKGLTVGHEVIYIFRNFCIPFLCFFSLSISFSPFLILSLLFVFSWQLQLAERIRYTGKC